MKNKALQFLLICIVPLLLLSGFSFIGDKTTSISIIYLVTTILSFGMFLGYLSFIKKKEKWFIILFFSVFIVNLGYLLLSVSPTLSVALQANRLSYLGSVFLPLSMIMIIMNLSTLNYKKWVPFVLAGVSVAVFLIAATPGYSNIYYKSVSLANSGGASILVKEYGPWHSIYLFYLLGSFSAMSLVTFHAVIKGKIDSIPKAIILIISVLVNICVWLLEQLVKIDFEFLSVSYIISELFLLTVYMMIEHQEVIIASLQARIASTSEKSKSATVKKDSPEFIEQCNFIIEQLPHLTVSEKAIYDCYLKGMSTKEVMQEMNIAENTLKFHNKNIYSKLGVSSRKQLLEYAKAINK